MKQVKQGVLSHSLKDIFLWKVHTLETRFIWEDTKMQNKGLEWTLEIMHSPPPFADTGK